MVRSGNCLVTVSPTVNDTPEIKRLLLMCPAGFRPDLASLA